MEEDRGYCVYILSCADDSLYTGMTLDLDRQYQDQAQRGSQAQETQTHEAETLE